ncbi:hypothetical protein HMPREF1199_00603 [Hoylesella oralis CC98A]|nr:hypothetical protein HMPREF1199_00603 [Hoylesella oralis CC98A]
MYNLANQITRIFHWGTRVRMTDKDTFDDYY